MKVQAKLRKPKKRDLRNALDRQANRRTEGRKERDDAVRVFVNDPTGGALVLTGCLVNLSGKGALIRADDSLKPGEECLVTIVGSQGDLVVESAFAMVRWACIREERDFLIGIEYADKQAATS